MPAEMNSYEERPRRSQIEVMRVAARAALSAYPFEVDRIRLLDHGHNTTFRVDTASGERFALRLNVNSDSTVGHLLAETAWLEALTRADVVGVPRPVVTRAGDRYGIVASAGLGRPVPHVLMTWLRGPHIDDASPEMALAMGRAMAALHAHASSWTMPSGATLPSHASVLIDQPNRIQGDHQALDDHAHHVIDAALLVAQSAMDRAFAQSLVRPIHADLHPGNVKWFRRQLSVFDFDDVVLGVPELDLAISSYYLRGRPSVEEALWSGYGAAGGERIDGSGIDALLAARNLVLLNDMLGAQTSSLRAMLARYVSNTVLKLATFLDTGRYRHDVDGFVPLEF